MTSFVVNIIVKTLEDGRGLCILTGYKYYTTRAIIVNVQIFEHKYLMICK